LLILAEDGDGLIVLMVAIDEDDVFIELCRLLRSLMVFRIVGGIPATTDIAASILRVANQRSRYRQSLSDEKINMRSLQSRTALPEPSSIIKLR